MDSQSLVRSLKSPSDPPNPGFPHKIQISKEAWENSSHYVPRKGEVISEWLLSKFLKDKDAEQTIHDPRYWNLLYDIISTDPTNKTWLPPLLARFNAASFISNLFLSIIIQPFPLELSKSIHNCLVVLWPIGSSRLSTEILLECWHKVMTARLVVSLDEHISSIGGLVISTFRSSFGNASTKKKIYSLFLENHLETWLKISNPDGVDSLSVNAYIAGIEILFNLELLRQSNYIDTEEHLFATLEKTDLTQACLLFGHIFKSYVSMIKRYRSAIYPHASTQGASTYLENIRNSSLRFVQRCHSTLANANMLMNKEAWSARVSLLKVIQDEEVYNTHNTEYTVFNDMCIQARKYLSLPCDNQELMSYAVETLVLLLHLDCDLVITSLPEIMTRFLGLANFLDETLSFLDLVIDHYSKIRSVNAYISTVFQALSLKELSDANAVTYQLALSSSLFHVTHLERLAKAVQLFLIPSQISITVQEITEVLSSLCDQRFGSTNEDDLSGTSRKKRKLSQSTTDVNDIRLALHCRIAGVVLAALPLQSLSTDLEEIVLNQLTSLQTSLIRVISKTLKCIRQPNDQGEERAISSLLRLVYTLRHPRGYSGLAASYKQKTVNRILDAVGGDSGSAELKLELTRTLLDYCGTQGVEESQKTLEPILGYMSSLASTSLHGTLFGFVRLITQQWLPLVDAIASPSQLDVLLQCIFKLVCDQTYDNIVFSHTLGSGLFWELSNIRSVRFLAYIESILSTSTPESDTMKTDVIRIYKVILAVPQDYFTRAMKVALVKTAISFDTPNLAEEDTRLLHVCISKLLPALDSIGPDFDLYGYFESLHTRSDDNASVTLDLIHILASVLLKSLGSADGALKKITLFYLYKLPSITFAADDMLANGLMRIIALLIDRLSAPNLSGATLQVLRELYEGLLKRLHPALSEISAYSSDDFHVLRIWHYTLLLNRWLGMHGSHPLYGQTLFSKVLTNSSCESHCAVWSILWEDVLSSPENLKLQNIQLLAADYIILAKYADVDGLTGIDNVTLSICKELSVSDYSYFVGFLTTSLREHQRSREEFSLLVRLITIALYEAPPGTAQISQTNMTQCINIICNTSDDVLQHTDVRQKVLQLLLQRCSDRPTTLRPIDIGAIWSLLSTFLSKSRQHDPETSPLVFHNIVGVISAIIRLRRDLITPTIPHLSMLLRRLILILRRPRQRLGEKQSCIVSNSFPSWINLAQPLGSNEGASLSRVLEALTIKSVPRKHSTSASESRKAESLAKPFSKHSAHILKAYLSATNEPLCVFPADIRNSLLPGLFSLCDMMHEQNRDAMMLSALDASERISMKNLWQEYEKQQYVGRG